MASRRTLSCPFPKRMNASSWSNASAHLLSRKMTRRRRSHPIADVQLDRAIDVIKGVKLFEKQMKVAKQNAGVTTATAAATPSTQ